MYEKVSLYRVENKNWNLSIFLFCVNFIAMTTPFAPLKFLLAYLYSPTLKTLYMQHCLHVL